MSLTQCYPDYRQLNRASLPNNPPMLSENQSALKDTTNTRQITNNYRPSPQTLNLMKRKKPQKMLSTKDRLRFQNRVVPKDTNCKTPVTAVNQGNRSLRDRRQITSRSQSNLPSLPDLDSQGKASLSPKPTNYHLKHLNKALCTEQNIEIDRMYLNDQLFNSTQHSRSMGMSAYSSSINHNSDTLLNLPIITKTNKSNKENGHQATKKHLTGRIRAKGALQENSQNVLNTSERDTTGRYENDSLSIGPSTSTNAE